MSKLEICFVSFFAAASLFGQPASFNVPPRDYYLPGAPAAIGMGDFSGGGKLDLIVSQCTASSVCLLEGNGDGALGPAVNFPAAGYAGGLAAADFNHDNKPDLAVASSLSVTLLTNTSK